MAKRKKKYFPNVFIFSLYSQACWYCSADLPLAVKAEEGLWYCQGQLVNCFAAAVPQVLHSVPAATRLWQFAGWLRKTGRSSA